MIKKSKKIVFRPGDKIKIVNPEIFVRCGYTLNKEEGLKLITEEEKKKVSELVELNYPLTDLFYQYSNSSDMAKTRVYDEILDRLAYLKIKQAGFGGQDRKIFTKLEEKYKDSICVVDSKRVVNTGIRDCHQEGDWETGYYASIPYLRRQKSHVILKVSIYQNEYINWENFEIEEKNVVKYDN